MGLATLPVHNGSIDRVAALQSSTMAEEHLLALALPPTKGNEASPGAMAAEAERTRRRHMSRLYAELGAQLPGLPPRVRPSFHIFFPTPGPFFLGHGLTFPPRRAGKHGADPGGRDRLRGGAAGHGRGARGARRVREVSADGRARRRARG